MALLAPNIFGDRLGAVLSSLDTVTLVLFIVAILGVCTFFYFSQRRTEWILVIVIVSAALVGSSGDLIDNGASILRWLGIGGLALGPILLGTPANTYRGAPLFFLLYALVSAFFLLNAVDFEQQAQRGSLLLATAIAIPWATAVVCRDGVAIKRLYTKVGIFGSVVALIAAMQLPDHIGASSRFAGISKGVPHFAMMLGSLLPFMFLNVWQAHNRIMRAFYVVTLVLGAVVLFFTAQRAGSLAGLIGILPILFVLGSSQKLRVALAVAAVAVGALIWASGPLLSTVQYVGSRYGGASDLSGRELLWKFALEMISRNALVGHGTGAAEVATRYLFHNAYLQVWYGGGALGIGLFVAAFARSIYVGTSLIFGRHHEFRKEVALSLGFALALAFVSFFEGAPAAASSISVVMYLVTAGVLEIVHRRRGEIGETLQEPAMDSPAQDQPQLQGHSVEQVY